jgi:uncharacterized membrane protein YfcA
MQFCYREVIIIEFIERFCMKQGKKHGSSQSRVILGSILVIIGISIFVPQILSTLFFRIIIALYLVWIGLRMIFNNNNNNGQNH